MTRCHRGNYADLFDVAQLVAYPQRIKMIKVRHLNVSVISSDEIALCSTKRWHVFSALTSIDCLLDALRSVWKSQPTEPRASPSYEDLATLNCSSRSAGLFSVSFDQGRSSAADRLTSSGRFSADSTEWGGTLRSLQAFACIIGGAPEHNKQD
jgi:hypothetical protein